MYVLIVLGDMFLAVRLGCQSSASTSRVTLCVVSTVCTKLTRPLAGLVSGSR
jgi:hypothetical protein